jgi:hypothetical protein
LLLLPEAMLNKSGLLKIYFNVLVLKQIRMIVYNINLTMSDSQKNKSVGRINQIIGPVLDIVFTKGQVPNIYNALTITAKRSWY